MSIFSKAKVKSLYTKNERYLFPVALLFGFIVDNFTLTRVDLWFNNLILFSYIFLAGFGIIVLNLYESGRLRKGIVGRISHLAPFVVQYSFGNLFSGFFVFYSRSSTLVGNWPFLLLLLVLLFGNEFFKKRYLRFDFQMSVFFIALFSYSICYTPILLEELSERVFLLSGVISLIIVTLFIFFSSLFIPKLVSKGRKLLIGSIGGLYVIINIFYFTNIIPPIPLSLKNEGVYHLVEKNKEGNYLVKDEEKSWYESLKDYKNEFHHVSGEPIYFYSAVFSPTDLNIKIYHSWQYYDEGKGEWVESFQKGYEIVGGRDGGYRGYTMKEDILPGRWRVDVMTERKQLLGRYNFVVIDVQTPFVLETKVF